MDKPGQHYAKKPVTKDRILYDSIYRKCPEEANVQKQRTDEWLLRAGEKREGQ